MRQRAPCCTLDKGTIDTKECERTLHTKKKEERERERDGTLISVACGRVFIRGD